MMQTWYYPHANLLFYLWTGKHPVSALIELCNKRRIMQPDFVMVHHSGPDHRKNFLFKVGRFFIFFTFNHLCKCGTNVQFYPKWSDFGHCSQSNVILVTASKVISWQLMWCRASLDHTPYFSLDESLNHNGGEGKLLSRVQKPLHRTQF